MKIVGVAQVSITNNFFNLKKEFKKLKELKKGRYEGVAQVSITNEGIIH